MLEQILGRLALRGPLLDRHDRPAILIGAGLALYAGWGGGTAIGVVAGDSLADPATLGLDAAFPAGMAVFLKAPLLLVIVVAAVTAGLLRAIG